MASKALLLKLSRWVDSEGDEHWTELRPEVAALLAETEPQLKERLLRKAESIEKVAGRSGNPWDGPRFRFRWLVGESRTWTGMVSLWLQGLVEVCPICKGAELPSWGYCLCCDRSGMDRQLPAVVAEDVPGGRIEAVEDEGLKGGLEGKR